jgi:site-specific DNA-cytosine methylase
LRTAGARPRVLELYCGIGGCAAALDPTTTVVAALDINTVALAVYRHNFAHPATPCALESLRADDPRLRDADLWWLSPPCQPYTRRGRGRDVDDPRSRSLLHLLDLIARLQPAALALENVPEFGGSRAHARLRERLAASGYAVAERLLCPSGLGVPNRRRRFYLVASREGLRGWATARPPSGGADGDDVPLSRLAGFLDPDDPDRLRVAPRLLADYAGAVDVVDAADPCAVASTFTAAYGRSPVRAGSYLRRDGVVRRFSPAEILRLLGFPPDYRLPPDLPLSSAWRLLGNSLSVPAVREVLAALPQLAAASSPA